MEKSDHLAALMPLHVLHIVSDLPSKDRPHKQPFIQSQIDSLIKLGLKIDIYNLTRTFGDNSFKYFKGIIGLRKKMNLTAYDLVHAHYSYCGGVGMLQRKVPMIVSLMGSDLLGDTKIDGSLSIRGRIDKLITPIVTSKADHIIVKSKNMAKYVRFNQNISVLPNGVDFQLFRPMNQIESKQYFGFNEDEEIVLFVGDPNLAIKNFRLAKAGIDRFKGKIDNLRLWIFHNRPQSDLALAMNAADVLLFTSYREGSPNIIKEAMATNLPIVSVDTGDVQEVINETRHCYMCEYIAEDVADKVAAVLEKRERSNGREKIGHLRIEKIAERLINIYDKILEGRNRH